MLVSSIIYFVSFSPYCYSLSHLFSFTSTSLLSSFSSVFSILSIFFISLSFLVCSQYFLSLSLSLPTYLSLSIFFSSLFPKFPPNDYFSFFPLYFLTSLLVLSPSLFNFIFIFPFLFQFVSVSQPTRTYVCMYVFSLPPLLPSRVVQFALPFHLPLSPPPSLLPSSVFLSPS